MCEQMIILQVLYYPGMSGTIRLCKDMGLGIHYDPVQHPEDALGENI